LFWPERWLIAENKDYVALPPSSPPPPPLSRPEGFIHNMDAFVPFSHGPANCVGQHLALQEMKTLVCYTMQKVDMRFADGYDSKEWLETLKEHVILSRGASLPIVVTRRN
jgi:cytochrome P450